MLMDVSIVSMCLLNILASASSGTNTWEQKIYTQANCEVVGKTAQGASGGRCQTVILLKCCMSRGWRFSGNVGGWRLGPPPPPRPLSIVLLLRYSLQRFLIWRRKKILAYHQHLVSARFVSNFDLRFEPTATCFYLRYSVSYTYIKLWQVITYKDDFMKVENYIAVNSEMCMKTQFKTRYPTIPNPIG